MIKLSKKSQDLVKKYLIAEDIGEILVFIYF